jgi:molybdopterin molybdotransferase
MAPLNDDCFAHSRGLMTVDEALEQIERRLEPVVEAENVPLRAAAGRVLAQDVVAGMDLPPHANSTVDGYAVAHSDLFPDRETVLSVGGRAAAGQSLGRPVCRGEAIRIFTGAPIPEGADTLIMQEDCVAIDGSDGGQVRVKPGQKRVPTTVKPEKTSLRATSRCAPGGACFPPISALPRRSAATGCRLSLAPRRVAVDWR